MEKPHILTARTPADLLAAVPCVLGFHPEDSLVMMTFSAVGRSFHARVDLPDEPEHVSELCALLLHAAVRNRVDRVVLVAYTTDVTLAGTVLEAVHDTFDAEDIDVIEMLRADGARCFPMRAGLPDHLYAGVPYDNSSHPFSAEAVLAGRVTHGSRQELAATLEPDPDAVAAVQEALRGRARRLPSAQVPAEARWVWTTVCSHVADGTTLPVEELARLVAACRDTELRDVVWSLITRETASRHVDLWRDVVRRCPVAWAAGPAGLLAFACWLSGQGALAWCALDRCREADPDYSMADRITEVLEEALPPHVWEGPDTSFLPSLGLDA
jgi:hypothetical protein